MNSEIVRVVSRIFQVPEDQISPETSPHSVAAWDSLGHLELVDALERRFDRRFTIDEIEKMSTVGEIAEIVAATPA